MRKLILFLLSNVFILFAINAFGQMGCPGCVIVVPDTLPEDTIYLSDAAPGRVGEAYDSDLSFRMPKTTTPVNASDPTVVPGLNISEITIVSVTNLPPGLTWEANQMVFQTSEQTDGCVKFCGLPLQPGLYEVEVAVAAKVLFITQTTSFSIPILIEPAVRITEGFTMENASGCGEVTVDFSNNVPSMGRNGFSYRWDFGNGRTTLDEHPGSQTYSEPGEYAIKYRAIVDTFGYTLTNVRIENVGCGDIFGGRPDLQLEVYAPDSSLLFKSEVTNNAVTPINYNLNLPINAGNYWIRVTDDDDGIFGGDEECGIITFNQLSTGKLSTVDMTASLTILHPVDTIESVDTVIVYPQPAKPLIEGYSGEALCEGDIIKLTSSYDSDIQWFQDTVPVIIGGVEPALTTGEDGVYWVQYTSPDGCQVISDPIRLNFAPLPTVPAFVNNKNSLTLFEPEKLPVNYEAQWFFNNNPIPNATSPSLCANATGEYRLNITNLDTGCSSTYSRLVNYDPAFAGCATTSAEDRFQELVNDLRVYPNPTSGRLWLEFDLNITADASVIITNALGAIISKTIHNGLYGNTQLEIDLSHQPAGMYFLDVQIENGRKNLRVIRQ